ncbi:unnamed protein product [Blepharisma stoltei]|uniref:Uncharacterized protein n=1 Tax=Blepharisma stoltei TaxID=1481888 RepID=A0AAU9JHS5_9CILI|nr:unnamed protein product [Blepharisma stoltei]
MADSRQEKIKSFTLSIPSYLATKRKLVLKPLKIKEISSWDVRRNSEAFKLPSIFSAREHIGSRDSPISPALDLLHSPRSLRGSPASSKYLPFIYAQNGLETPNEIMQNLKLRRDCIIPISRKKSSVNLLADYKQQSQNSEFHKRHKSFMMQSV